MSVTQGTTITKAHLDALAATANTKLTPATPYVFEEEDEGGWLTEFNRIRWDVTDKLYLADYYSYPAAIKTAINLNEHLTSGPYILLGHTNLENFRFGVDMAYCFPASLSPVTVAFKCSYGGGGGMYGPSTYPTEFVPFGNGNISYPRLSGTMTYKFRIGGSRPVTVRLVNARAYCIYDTYRTATRPADPSVTVTSTLPGMTYTVSPGQFQFFGPVTINVLAYDVAPGEYTITFSASGSDYWSFYEAAVMLLPELFEIEVSSTSESPSPGLHATQPIVEVHAPDSEFGPFGLYIDNTLAGMPGGNPPGPGNWINGQYYLNADKGGGWWRGRTYAPAGMNPHLWAHMPGNEPPTPSYTPVIRQKLPAPSTAPSGDIYEVTEPALNYILTEYPALRDTDPTPAHWHANWNPLGMFIRRIVVRRAPVANEHGIKLPPTTKPALSVALGCNHGATFHEFASVTIPEGADEVDQEVCWTVFPTAPAPIRYQCSEPVLVYAMPLSVINVPPGYTGIPPRNIDWSHIGKTGIFPPMFAVHYNDLEALLDLFP
jgi:hypothetical protein